MSKKASDRISKKKKKNKLSNYYITLETNFLVFRHLVPSSLGTRTKNYQPKDTQTTRSAD